MKILELRLKKGRVKVVPESGDDLWHLHNLIERNDEVYAKTTREVKIEQDLSRPKEGRRVPVFLAVRVEDVAWDKSLNRLRVHGIVCEAPEEINVKGSHHTINVTVDNPLTIVKPRWLRHHLDRLERASQVKEAPILLVSMDYEEYCVATLRQYGVEVKAEVRTRLPGKMETERRTKAKAEFFKGALKTLQEAWINSHNPIVIIGPGFVKDEFVDYLKRTASDLAQNIIDVKSVNSAGMAGIQEALRSGVLTKALKHLRLVEESRSVEEILERLGRERLDVTYGLADVAKAKTFGAVDKLLLTDTTLREANDEKRLTLEGIMREVEEKGGKIMVISAEHEAGEKLLALGGIAALLRFPVG